MKAWLYTECDSPVFDGPFYSFKDVEASPLFGAEGVSCWVEAKTSGGWLFQNRFFDGLAWRVTSRGFRPVAPIRPECVVQAKHFSLSDAPEIRALFPSQDGRW